jgi:hypothetical protein
MPISFPISPADNDTHVIGSITYQYNATDDKWTGLGISPSDRLIEGSNSLEINASNELIWTGSTSKFGGVLQGDQRVIINGAGGKSGTSNTLLNYAGDGTTVTASLTADGAAEFASGAFAINADGEIDTNVKSAGHIELDSTGAFTSPKIKLFSNTGNAMFTGDVGIGSSASPRTELDLFDGQLSFSHRTDYSIRFYNGTGNNWSSISNPSTNDGTNASALSFKTAQGEALRLASSGKVAIGGNYDDTTAFGRQVLVSGTISVNNDSGNVGVGFNRGSSNTYGYIGTGAWALNGLANDDFGISSGATGDLALGTLAGTERLRITSAGNVTIGAKSNPNWSSTVDALTIGYAGVLYEDSYTGGTNNYLILGNNSFYNASTGGNKYMRDADAMRIYMNAGQFAYQNAPAGTVDDSITFTDRLVITSDGEVTKPSNPAFIVRQSASETTWTITQGWQKIEWDEENLDRGGNFNTTTSEFTAPVTGAYLFGAEFQLETPVGATSGSWMYVSFVINGATTLDESKGGTRTDVNFAGSTYNSYAPTHLLNLNANDKVCMYRTGGSFTSIRFKGGSESVFWGYLVG